MKEELKVDVLIKLAKATSSQEKLDIIITAILEEVDRLRASNAKLLSALLDQACEICGIRFDVPSDFPCESCADTRDAIEEARK